MALNLLTYIQEQFTPTVVDQLGEGLGESPANVQKAIAGVIPTVLGGLTRRVQDYGAEEILNLLKDSNYGAVSTPLDVTQVTDTRFETQTAVATGRNFLRQLFKDDTDRIASYLAAYSGVSQASALSLMGLVGSVLKGILGRQYQYNGLSAFNLSSLLGGQAGIYRAALPEGLESMGKLLGFDKLLTPSGPQTDVQRVDNFENSPVSPNIPMSPEGERQRENVHWLRWIWIALAVLVAGLLIQKCRELQDGVNGVYTDTTRRAEPNAVEDTSASTKRNVEKSHGQTGDTVAPGALGTRTSTEKR